MLKKEFYSSQKILFVFDEIAIIARERFYSFLIFWIQFFLMDIKIYFLGYHFFGSENFEVPPGGPQKNFRPQKSLLRAQNGLT